MPSKTPKQARFMRACAGKGRAKVTKKCPPKSVRADARKARKKK